MTSGPTETKPITRGKRLTPEVLKRIGEWGRYEDIDGDAIPYRTVPGDGMPAYFARGSGHNAKAQYSERPNDYVENVNRLARKFDTARQYRESIDVYGSKKSVEWPLVEHKPLILHTAKRPEPEIPEEVRDNGLEALQGELRSLQQRMEALEPVNMLALQELEELETRLSDLQERLDVLCKEREELLLRIETVATLRQEAFMEAFTAVDGHFREIFAGLSEGEGHLQLENPEAPLEGGLTLVAHPKGKAVRRLAAMSGGATSPSGSG
mgnify:CR=1 FL=1